MSKMKWTNSEIEQSYKKLNQTTIFDELWENVKEFGLTGLKIFIDSKENLTELDKTNIEHEANQWVDAL